MYDETGQDRQRRRRNALNQAARKLGYQSWAQLETEVINDRVKLAVTDTPEAEREALVTPSPFLHLTKHRGPNLAEKRQAAIQAARAYLNRMGIPPDTRPADSGLAALEDVARIQPDSLAAQWYKSAGDRQIELFRRDWAR